MVNEGTRYQVRRALELFLNTGTGASVARLLASAVHSHAYIAARAPGSTGYVPPLHMTPPPFMLELIQHTSSAGLTSYVLNAPQQTLISANKEGLVFLTGKCCIILPLLSLIVLTYNSGDEDTS